MYPQTVPPKRLSKMTPIPELEPLALCTISMSAIWLSVAAAIFCYRFRKWFKLSTSNPFQFITPPSWDEMMDYARKLVKIERKKIKKSTIKPKGEMLIKSIIISQFRENRIHKNAAFKLLKL